VGLAGLVATAALLLSAGAPATGKAAPAPAGKAAPAPAHDDLLRTAGGEVTARRPAGAAWTCRPFARAGEGFSLAEVSCRMGDGPDLLLSAKDYAGPRETLDGLCGQDWADYFKELIPALPKVTTRRLVLDRRPTCAVEVRGLTAAGQATRVLEWYAVAPGHVLVISAAGPAAAMDAAARVVEAWRDGVAFAAAASQPATPAAPSAPAPAPKER
jgi:hypothetical protein